uniref:Uncharacterized protein n=1 Tax=Trichinella nativa TaxID=6335 RepID=A0A0V1KJE9_9BILA
MHDKTSHQDQGHRQHTILQQSGKGQSLKCFANLLMWSARSSKLLEYKRMQSCIISAIVKLNSPVMVE